MNRRVLIAVAVAALLIGAGLIGWLRLQERQQATALTLYGNVDIREVNLAFRVPGKLTEMAFEEGDEVTAGERMARLDAAPYRDALAAAEARVQQAQANLDKFKAGNRPQDVERARAQVREAEAEYKTAQSDFVRQSGLLESGASSEKATDAARARRDAAAARLASAREALALAEAGYRSEDIAAAAAELAAAVAQRDQAKTQLEDTELTAPSGGIVLSRVREPGSVLTFGMPVYSLSLRNPVYVRAYVEEPDLGKIAPGMKVTVSTDSSSRAYRGQIGFISPRAEFTPKTVQTTDLRTELVYRLRISVQNADQGLRQGMPVTIHVPLGDAGSD
jgi:HlyD family secretion protein